MEVLKIGERFEPSDKECLAYLLHKVTGQALMPSFFISIPTIHIYGEAQHPSLIFPASDHEENYFDARLKKPNINDDQVHSRASGKGVWAKCGKKYIVDSIIGLFGFLTLFKYEGQTDHEDNNHEWLLKEYTLSNKYKACCLNMEYLDFVFCMVKRNPEVKVDPEKRDESLIQDLIDEMLTQG
ncbi:UNVERIFIED_CONTAM: hypothetical protein Slati_3203100 [Sesamum latifolium]|uniref:NAC domain-containing protein n=1 Tax=Sesamum latifolium TaxID=2727402 RepID=A0AAW2UZD1_9LAMI